MCLVLDQFLWGHSSRVCDISCSLDTYSIDTDHYANFGILRKTKIESVGCAFY